MALPNSYTMKTGAITAYFDAIRNGEAPDRFSIKFLEGLGFASSNDRLLIGILKDIGFLNADGAPQERYFQFLDKSISSKVLAEGIRDAYSDLFAVNTSADKLDATQANNKLRALYRGEKKDSVVKMIARTFVALCDYADFESTAAKDKSLKVPADKKKSEDKEPEDTSKNDDLSGKNGGPPNNIGLNSLQYHINIVLPDTRDQATFDAIFKSLRDHLG